MQHANFASAEVDGERFALERDRRWLACDIGVPQGGFGLRYQRGLECEHLLIVERFAFVLARDHRLLVALEALLRVPLRLNGLRTEPAWG
jgi:hypothetical protein